MLTFSFKVAPRSQHKYYEGGRGVVEGITC